MYRYLEFALIEDSTDKQMPSLEKGKKKHPSLSGHSYLEAWRCVIGSAVHLSQRQCLHVLQSPRQRRVHRLQFFAVATPRRVELDEDVIRVVGDLKEEDEIDGGVGTLNSSVNFQLLHLNRAL